MAVILRSATSFSNIHWCGQQADRPDGSSVGLLGGDAMPLMSSSPEGGRAAWNYTPELPLRSAPFLHWPLRPSPIARHIGRTWLPLRSRFFMLAVSFAVWAWFMPSLERTESFEFSWIFGIWLRNLILVTLVAGGLHVWFYVVRRQGDALLLGPRAGRQARFELGDFHHQIHHRFIECNYGGYESPLDELLGAWHDGTPKGAEVLVHRARKRAGTS